MMEKGERRKDNMNMDKRKMKFKDLIATSDEFKEKYEELSNQYDEPIKEFMYSEEFLNVSINDKNQDWGLPGSWIREMENIIDNLK